jgi:hypothetical protein
MSYFKLPPPRDDYNGALGGFMFANGVCTVPDDHEANAAARKMLCTYYAAKECHEYPKQDQQSGDSSPSSEGSPEVPDVDQQADGEAETGSEGDDSGSGDGLRSDASDEPGDVDSPPTEAPVLVELTDKQTEIVYKAIDSLDPTEVKHWNSPGIPNAEFLYRLTNIPIPVEQLDKMVKDRKKPNVTSRKRGSKAKTKTNKKTS